MPLSTQVFFFEELGSNVFHPSLSAVVSSVLRNAMLTIPASHFKVQMPVSLTSLVLEFFSGGQLLPKLVLMCFWVWFEFGFLLVGGCRWLFFLSMLRWRLIEESMRPDHR